MTLFLCGCSEALLALPPVFKQETL